VPQIRVLALLGVAYVLVGCGSSPTDAVDAKVHQFAHAVAAGDAATLCDQVLAPALVTRLTDAGISCSQAMKTFVQSVQDPTIAVGKVTVSGRSASALVTTGAKGQPASKGTLELTRTKSGWRLVSLVSPR
jgi:ketosteroid isomerase-like protein